MATQPKMIDVSALEAHLHEHAPLLHFSPRIPMNLPSSPLACVLTAALIASCQSSNTADVSPSSTSVVADRYIELLTTERDQDAAVAMMSEDVTFIDPTAEVWGGTLGNGVAGRDVVDALQKSWGVEQMSYEVAARMVTGDHALFSGKLSWQITGAPMVKDVPFITMLIVRDGEIVARKDLGDYDELVLGEKADTTAINKVAAEYIEVYGQHNIPAMEKLLAPDAVFIRAHSGDDGADQEIRGAAAIAQSLGDTELDYSVSEFSLKRFISSYRHVVYVGECRVQKSLANGSTSGATMPLWVSLKVVDGRIVEQQDYCVIPARVVQN